jgi:hypothetical protein
MRTIIYVDGFNLYYRLLEKRLGLRWLNLKALAAGLLRPANVITGIRYYTAHISGRVDPTAPARQQRWLGLSEQRFGSDKWNVCRVQVAAACGKPLK